MVIVRPEAPGDVEGISAVQRDAFGGPLEARLVNALRAAGDLKLSFVAERDGEVIGHIAFSPVQVAGSTSGYGLAPLAVKPRFQKQGVGRELMSTAMRACSDQGVGFVVVLGDPAYYSRFGFEPARKWGLVDTYGGGDAFQLIELQPGSVPRGAGVVRYAPAFDLSGQAGPAAEEK